MRRWRLPWNGPPVPAWESSSASGSSKCYRREASSGFIELFSAGMRPPDGWPVGLYLVMIGFTFSLHLENYSEETVSTISSYPKYDLPSKVDVLSVRRMIQFSNVTAIAKGNVYFEGKVVSHSIVLPNGSKKTLGVILPGRFHFATDAAERMEIIEGDCTVKLDDESPPFVVVSGHHFDVPVKSGFTIAVEARPTHYVCSFLV